MKKGIIEYCVLAVINRKGNSYGYEIVKELSDGGLLTQEGTIYPLLSRLEKDDLLNATWRQQGPGAPRKYYHLTNQGQRKLSSFRAEWLEFSTAVDRILEEGKNE